MEESNIKIIQIDHLNTNGVTFESIDQFEQSIFSGVYEKATRLVENIVEDNQRRRDSLNSIQYVKREEEIPNIISFIGRRGTGKTSAMLSFYEELQKYSAYKGQNLDKTLKFQERCMRQVVFRGLDCIDASSLEESEDVFVLVISQMLNQILDMSRQKADSLQDYENRSLLQKFEKLYEDFINIKEQSDVSLEGYSSFERLKNITSSQKIRKQFSELVERYLKFVLDGNDCTNIKSNAYLVIAVDDLDMYKKTVHTEKGKYVNRGPYEIMRSIHQYLSVPNVIVLVAYNHVYLYEQCLEYFSNVNSSREETGLRNKEIASQYMEKNFPINSRLYMPSLRKRDFDNENTIRINIRSENSDGNILPLKQKNKKYSLSIKEFLLALLGEKADIYFDCKGKKRHFFEPDTLRSLYSSFSLLQDMENLSDIKDEQQRFEYHRKNIRLLKEDMYFRFIEEKLTDISEKTLFDQWLEQKVDRRGESIVHTLSKTTRKLGKLAKLKYEERIRRGERLEDTLKDAELIFDNRNVEYSYAELIHSIYHMTRDEVRYSKELVACILYSFTLTMSEIYWNYHWYKRQISQDALIRCARHDIGELKEERCGKEADGTKEEKEVQKIKEYHILLKEVIGSTICGRWAEYYFPEVRMKKGIEAVSDGYILGYADNCRLKWSVAVEYHGNRNLEQQLDYIKSGKDAEFLYKIYQMIFVAGLQTDTLSWANDEVSCQSKPDMNRMCGIHSTMRSESSSQLIFSFEEIYPHLNHSIELTACFKYVFCYSEFLSKLERLLLEALSAEEKRALKTQGSRMSNELQTEKIRMVQIGKKTFDIYRELIIESFDRIWKDYAEWDQQHGNMMIPVYNLDITYNLIKRVFQECTKEHIPSIIVNSQEEHAGIFLMEYMHMLDRFRLHLGEIDEYYGYENGRFEQAFAECPFYKMVVKLSQDRNSQIVISQYIESLIEDLEVASDNASAID